MIIISDFRFLIPFRHIHTLIPHGSVDSSNEVNISLAILSRSERISAKLLVPVNKKEIVNKQTKLKYKRRTHTQNSSHSSRSQKFGTFSIVIHIADSGHWCH